MDNCCRTRRDRMLQMLLRLCFPSTYFRLLFICVVYYPCHLQLHIFPEFVIYQFSIEYPTLSRLKNLSPLVFLQIRSMSFVNKGHLLLLKPFSSSCFEIFFIFCIRFWQVQKLWWYIPLRQQQQMHWPRLGLWFGWQLRWLFRRKRFWWLSMQKNR